MSVPSATRWSIVWLVVGVALAVPVGLIADGDVAVDYVTVYLVERSLSLDNVFLFLLILSAFAVPEGLQRRLLLIGVAVALGVRALAIVVGAELLERFSFVSYALGARVRARDEHRHARRGDRRRRRRLGPGQHHVPDRGVARLSPPQHLSASAASGYLDGKQPYPDVVASAAVQGYTTAFWWVVAIFAAGALVSGLLDRKSVV